MATLPLRTKIGLVIGGVMFALGAFLSVNLTFTRTPKTGSILGDLVFMTFFLVKGLLYFRQAWRRPASPDAHPSPSASTTASTSQDGD
jgi:hypothetical protein